MTTKRAAATNGKQALTFLCIDPGVKNTGWSEDIVTPSGKLRVLRHGVFKHDNDPEANAEFFKSLACSNHIVLIEKPPIIRVNASTSHSLAIIYGAIFGALVTSNVKFVGSIPPRTWQHSLLHDEYEYARKHKKKILKDEKELLIKALVNKNITRKKTITDPHVIDTIAIVLYFCKKYNGTILETVTTKELKKARRKKRS